MASATLTDVKARVAALALSTTIIAMVVACLPDDRPPGMTAPPLSCGDGRCEPQIEDCARCPEDCPCCAIIDSRGKVPDGENATLAMGRPDAQAVQLDARSDLTLAFGRDVFDCRDPAAPLADFQIHGTLSSASQVPRRGTCPSSGSGKTGAFEVMVSQDGVDWQFLGLWGNEPGGAAVDTFDVACAGLTAVRWIRLKGQSDAAAQLDAVTAITDAQGNSISCIDANAARPTACLSR